MNRRSFLALVGTSVATTAVGTALLAEFLAAPVGATGAPQGGELVVNGSFESGAPGPDLPGWAVVV